MRKLCLCAAVVASCFLTFGCGGKPKPDGMPDLYKTTIVVTHDGAPLADAALSLLSDDPSLKWAVGGKTDANGRAELTTHGDFKGAPAGTYRVGVVKMEYEIREGAVDEEGNPVVITEEMKKNPATMDVRYVNTRSLIPDEYTNPANSPLEITIDSSPSEIALEVPAE